MASITSECTECIRAESESAFAARWKRQLFCWNRKRLINGEERFNRSYRQEVLDAYVLESIEEVRSLTQEWLDDYNEERPHDSLGGVPPRSFLSRLQNLPESSYQVSI